MTDDSMLSLILDGQKEVKKAIADELRPALTANTVAVTKLEVQVKQLFDQRQESQGVHRDCRDEVDDKFEANERDHSEIKGRVKVLENVHIGQSAEGRVLYWGWRVVVGALGATLLVLEVGHAFGW